MRYWLARTLRETRLAHGVNRREILALVPGQRGQMDPATLYRFEKGETWPHNLDQLVVAYARLCGIEDARKLWANAVAAYKAHGTAPVLGPVPISPALRALLLAQEAAGRETPPYGDESQDKPTSTQKQNRRRRNA